MTLSKKCCSPRKVVLESDPALDLENSDYSKYIEDLFDEDHIKFFDDEEPTRFTIKQLTSNQKTFMSGISNPREKSLWAIKFSLISIQNFSFEKDGSVYSMPPIEYESAGKLGEVIKDKWINDADFNADVLYPLEVLIYMFSEARIPLSKPS